MSSWVCKPLLLLHKTLAPLHPFSSTPSPPPTVRHHLYLRRPSTSAAPLHPTPTHDSSVRCPSSGKSWPPLPRHLFQPLSRQCLSDSRCYFAEIWF
ncbi:hypothetical protein HanIR_Chr16g0819411 [Helianthus annuus]|nr:hypothetical protein HanIR_Chr16g0819411 [Helianthus annuus]